MRRTTPALAMTALILSSTPGAVAQAGRLGEDAQQLDVASVDVPDWRGPAPARPAKALPVVPARCRGGGFGPCGNLVLRGPTGY